MDCGRFGNMKLDEIDHILGETSTAQQFTDVQSNANEINNPTEIHESNNTNKPQESCWTKFTNFCASKNFPLDTPASVFQLNQLLIDYSSNMKLKESKEFKESEIKSMWYIVAKVLQEKYFIEFKIRIDPFTGVEFKGARAARDSKFQRVVTAFVKILPKKPSQQGNVGQELSSVGSVPVKNDNRGVMVMRMDQSKTGITGKRRRGRPRRTRVERTEDLDQTMTKNIVPDVEIIPLVSQKVEEEQPLNQSKALDSKRFSNIDLAEINKIMDTSTSKSTEKVYNHFWAQFLKFCEDRMFSLQKPASPMQLNKLLADYALNKKRVDGDDYTEGVVKCMWSTAANRLKEKYQKEFNIKINPFVDIEFQEARNARDSKREQLKSQQISGIYLNLEYNNLIKVWNENTPNGLQRKLFLVLARELTWRNNEAAKCVVRNFMEVIDSSGKRTEIYEYNPIFSELQKGESHVVNNSKWLVPNTKDPNVCPVRLLKIMLKKRTSDITIENLFLKVNPKWTSNEEDRPWYINMPVKMYEIQKWMRGREYEIIMNAANKESSTAAATKVQISKQPARRVAKTRIRPILPQPSTSSGHVNIYNCNFRYSKQ